MHPCLVWISSSGEDPAEAAQKYLDLYNMAVADAADKSEAKSEA